MFSGMHVGAALAANFASLIRAAFAAKAAPALTKPLRLRASAVK